MALVTTPLFPVMLPRATYRSLARKEILCKSAGRNTTMLKIEATTKPIACATIPSPARAITSATTAPNEKKSKKNETLRSSPAKARAASTAQKIMSSLPNDSLLNLDSIPTQRETPTTRGYTPCYDPQRREKGAPLDHRIREGPRGPAQGRAGGRARPQSDEGEPRAGDDHRRARRRRRAGLREVRGDISTASALRVPRRELHKRQRRGGARRPGRPGHGARGPGEGRRDGGAGRLHRGRGSHGGPAAGLAAERGPARLRPVRVREGRLRRPGRSFYQQDRPRRTDRGPPQRFHRPERSEQPRGREGNPRASHHPQLPRPAATYPAHRRTRHNRGADHLRGVEPDRGGRGRVDHQDRRR